MSEVVGFDRLLEQRPISQCHSTKLEDMEFLKAMLAEMNANMKSNQEKAEAKRKADRDALKEMIHANQEHLLGGGKWIKKRGRLKGKPTKKI
jgi:hypothetical protein